MSARRFPPPWSVEDPDPKIERQCFIVRDHNGQALAYVYFEDEPGRRSVAHLMTPDEATARAINIAAGVAARPAALPALGSPSTTVPGPPGDATAPSRRKPHKFPCCRHRSERHTGR